MRTPWPWDAAPRSPIPTLNGDVEAFLATGFWADEASLQQAMALLCSGIPGSSALAVHLERRGSEYKFSIDREDCKFQKRIVITDDGVELHSDLYFLIDTLRNTGLGKKMFRNSLIAYDSIGVLFVTAVANYYNGGYTWAKLAGRVFDPAAERIRLRERLDLIAKVEKFSQRDILALENLIKETPDEDLMREIACCASPSGAPLGKALLVGHSWEVFWDLSDNRHRSQIAEALRP